MRTLEQHNRSITDKLSKGTKYIKNGIGCPKCSKELVDSISYGTFLSEPPQKAVECAACGWKGTRLA